MNAKFQISGRFNIILFVFLCFSIAMDYLFKPETKEAAPWDTIYDKSPVIAITGAFVVGAILIFGGARILHHFWNRFISDTFKIRDISFQEALAIIFIVGILFRIL